MSFEAEKKRLHMLLTSNFSQSAVYRPGRGLWLNLIREQLRNDLRFLKSSGTWVLVRIVTHTRLLWNER